MVPSCCIKCSKLHETQRQIQWQLFSWKKWVTFLRIAWNRKYENGGSTQSPGTCSRRFFIHRFEWLACNSRDTSPQLSGCQRPSFLLQLPTDWISVATSLELSNLVVPGQVLQQKCLVWAPNLIVPSWIGRPFRCQVIQLWVILKFTAPPADSHSGRESVAHRCLEPVEQQVWMC